MKLVDGLTSGVGKIEDMTLTNAAGGTSTLTFNDLPNGKWKALVDMYGTSTGTEAHDGSFTKMLTDLDEMANVFTSAFNTAHGTNKDADGVAGRTDFFVGTASAATITVNPDFMKNLDLIAASKDGNIGDGSGALELAQLKESALNFAGSVTTSTSIGKYYQNVIGNMAVEASQNANLAKSTFALLSSSDQRRLSVSAVSLDEEMTMMIQYQHAYNAAARNITAVDEMLDKIINGMGVVGR